MFILASTLMYISCDVENFQNLNECSGLEFNTFDFESVPIMVESMIDYGKTLHFLEGMESIDEIHSEVFGDSELSLNRVGNFKIEAEKYSRLGFEDYVIQSEYFSNNFKGFYIENATDIVNYLENEHPSLEEALTLIDNKISGISQSGLCAADRKIAEVYYNWVKGYLNYAYSHFYSNETIGLRDCSFWESIGCGILAVTIGLALTAIGVLLAIGKWVYITATGEEEEFGSTKETVSDVASILFFLSLGYIAGTSFYDWCCNKDEIPEQECLPPTMASLTQIGCNEFKYRITGHSMYGATSWTNENTSPSIETTLSPLLRFSIPSFGTMSNIKAQIACIEDNGNGVLFTWEENVIFESNDDVFPLLWSQPPPSNIIGGSEIPGEPDLASNVFINVKVNTPSNEIMSYQWTVNEPHLIVNGGGVNDNYATINLGLNSQNLTTRVRATNTCLNETESLMFTTNIE